MNHEDRELLSRARSGWTPGRRDRDRMRARLIAGVGAAGALGAAGSAAAGTGATGSLVPKLLLALLAGGATIAGITVLVPARSAPDAVGAVPREHAEAPSPGAAPIEAREPDLPASAVLEAPEPEPTPATPAEPAAVAPPRRRAAEPTVAEGTPGPTVGPTAEPAPEPAAELDTLAAETALVREARRLLRDDPRAALRVLDEHTRDYPTGVLAEERDVQRIRTLCALGEVAEAERQIAAFRRAHPGSLHAPSRCEPR